MDKILDLSRDGSCWYWRLEVFAPNSLQRSDSPSAIKDSEFDWIAQDDDGYLMAYRGKRSAPTKAALARERNRGLGRE